MARVTIPSDLQRYTGGRVEVHVSAVNYRDLVAELCQRFPALTEETIVKQALAIDGMIFHSPLLESFQNDSKLVLFTKIAGG